MIKGLYPIFNHWHGKGTVWVTSDTHFNDPELWVGANRVVRDNDELVKIINSKVGKNDTVIHLGDVGQIDFVKKIKGYKVLIMGNHDAGMTKYQRKLDVKLFDKDKYSKSEALAEMKKLYPNCQYTIDEKFDFHAPFETWIVVADNRLFDEVYSGPLMISEKIILSHEPVTVPWAFNIHGHVHYPGATGDNSHLNVCPDARRSFEPINFNQLMKNGIASKVESIHRITIDAATVRSIKKGSKSK